MARDFDKMTEIQRCVLPHALANRDIMAASHTGSGKTLCYLIPVIEKLHRHKFIPMDGLGAVIIVPVRELAIQVFEVLNSFTQNIELNIGLIIGGKDVEY
jgi:ATP-dependent RNA helicase DDX10/DBP4